MKTLFMVLLQVLLLFLWDVMQNHVEQRQQFVGNCGPESEAQIETYFAKVFRIDKYVFELCLMTICGKNMHMILQIYYKVYVICVE
jgi:hypothetical protein